MLLVSLALPAWAERRVALLIGNSHYAHAIALPNPVNDVRLLASTLSSAPLDFEVEALTDATRSEITRTLFDFLNESRDADLTLIFFAGHGLQFQDENYLLGTEAQLATPFDLPSEAIALTDLIETLRADGRTALVFIDACRNNPLARSFYATALGESRAAAIRGLAPLDLSSGTAQDGGIMLAFSASPGQVAVDGPAGGNSPFAQALADHLRTPGIEILSAMRRVMRDVRQVTAGLPEPQVPIFTADLVDEIYLVGPPGAEPGQPSPAGSEVVGTLAQDPELAAFNAAIAVGTADAWDDFLRAFPEGRYGGLARQERTRLQALVAEPATGPPATDPPLGEAAGPQSADGAGSEPGSDEAQEPTDPARQFTLGSRYLAGSGGRQRYSDAARWYERSADQGFAPAQNGLGYLYERGLGVAEDPEAAAMWYRLAAEQGYAPAQTNLGFLYESGSGVVQSTAEALRLYRLAADQGSAQAQTNLGLAYLNGRGVPRDVREALRWLRQAADAGHAPAQTSLGYMFSQGLGVPQDQAEAARMFGLAADGDDPLARTYLGYLYAFGHGVPQDPDRAAALLLQAFEAGDAYARRELADRRGVDLPVEARRSIQVQLRDRGLYAGQADGDFDRPTLDALAALGRHP